jgi:hypothetical protein
VPVVRERAASTERQRRLRHETEAAFRAAGFYRILVDSSDAQALSEIQIFPAGIRLTVIMALQVPTWASGGTV